MKKKPVSRQLSIEEIAAQNARLAEAVPVTSPARLPATIKASAMVFQPTAPEHGERDHALCSPSSADRWTVCTGSVALLQLVPVKEETEYAKEGTRAHELVERMFKGLAYHWNKNGKWHPAIHDIMDFTMHQDYPQDMWEHCKGYVQLMIDLVNHYKPKKIFLEKRVYISRELNVYGTADFFFAFKDPVDKTNKLFVMDFKYGRHYIVPPSSIQLIAYGAGVLESFPKAKVSEIWTNIYQPRAQDEEEAHRGPHKIKIEDLQPWKTLLLTKAKEALVQIGKPVAELSLTPGDQCKWCDAQAICPAYTKFINEKAGLDFADDPDLLPAPAHWNAELAAEQIDIEQLSKVLRIATSDVVKKYFANAIQVGINLLLSGVDLNGDWKVVEGRRQRKWKASTDVASELVKLGIQEPHVKKLKGLGAIEDELKRNGVKGKKAQQAAIAGLVEMSKPPIRLALIDDPRPALTSAEIAAKDFDVLDPEEEFLD